jgi:probable F420-dependent oxidoreductase
MRFCQSMMYAAPEQWVELARHAENVGFDQIALSDHVFYPEKLASSYPYSSTGRPVFSAEAPWPDVWVMVGAMAAATQRIEFTTNVYVLPARNPFVVAKAVGTASWLSGGRVSLGVGAGWMREEFDALEQPFDRRGKRMEEQIQVIRTLWQGGMVEHHGTFYDFDRLQMAPVPPGPVPILVGGHSDVALRRAARIGDGWIGIHYTLAELREYIAKLQALR